MKKIGTSLKGIICIGLFVTTLSVFSQTESITITTYYPSPYGVYNNLQAQKLGVGDTNKDGALTSADLPARDGDIRLRPQFGDPATWPAGQEGELAYSESVRSFYYYDGSSWLPQGGSSGGVVLIGLDSAPACPAGWVTALTGRWMCPLGGTVLSGVDAQPGGTCFCADVGTVSTYRVYSSTSTAFHEYSNMIGIGAASHTMFCRVCVR